MSQKAYIDIMCGHKDSNIRFSDVQKVLEERNFFCRIRGDHFIYKRHDIPERTIFSQLEIKPKLIR